MSDWGTPFLLVPATLLTTTHAHRRLGRRRTHIQRAPTRQTRQEQMGGRGRGRIHTRCKPSPIPIVTPNTPHRATGKNPRTKKPRTSPHPPQLHHSRKRARSKPSWQKKKPPKPPVQPWVTTTTGTTKMPSSIRAKRRVWTRNAKYRPISRTQRPCLALRGWEVSDAAIATRLGCADGGMWLGSSSKELDALISADPRTKEDFQALSAQIIEFVIKRHQNKPLYPSFVEYHVRQLAEPLKDVEVRKAASSLTTLANEKQKEQRDKAAGKKKPKSAVRPTLGAAKVSGKCVPVSLVI